VAVQKALDRHGVKRQEISLDRKRKGFNDGRGRPRLTGDAVTKQVMYGRARGLVGPGSCVVCSDMGKHINHKDRNPWNDARANMERLCVKCHNRQHSMEEAVMIEWLRERFNVPFLEIYEEARRRLLASAEAGRSLSVPVWDVDSHQM
jgi:5-methylcytosine-specific restriction endonuclease McrA